MTRPDKSIRQMLHERRSATRFPCALQATCRTSTGATADVCSASVRDISRTGVGLVTGPAFALGSQLTVQLRHPGGGMFSADAQVIYAHPDARGWVHGCKFVNALGEEELAELVR